ncbi:MAG: hypothetical protein AB4050_19605 [Synechococcus sp.]
MAFQLDLISGISREIREWVNRYDRNNMAEKERANAAVVAISTAVLETRKYLASLNANERDIDEQSELSNLWNDAHIKIRTIDSEFADRCFLKAEYWTDPTSYTENDIAKYNIALDDMSIAARNFLDG